MSNRRAAVWCAERKVGELLERDGRIWLRYDPEWLEKDGFAISLRLALSARELDAHDFFVGLLPEARARERVAREYRLQGADDFGLLLALGRDCAGVLSVLPEGTPPTPAQDLKALTPEDLVMLIESRGVAVPEGSESQRFSLAGAQDKVAVRITSEGMWLPDQLRPSTHIVKFETLTRVCLAEFLGSDLARRSGLSVAPSEYRQLESGTPYLLVERYDRFLSETGEPRRLHQEDVAQALGYPSSLKYEEHGGPSLEVVADLIRRHTASPVQDLDRLQEWQLFNYFIGNYDGHAKNLSLLYSAGDGPPRLGPFYDLVCLEFLYRINIRFSRTFAFHIAGKATPEEIGRKDWEAFARQLRVSPKRLLQKLEQMANALPPLARQSRASWASKFGDNQMLDRFEEAIADRCRWTLNLLAG